jgi:hypothetical protein
MEVIRSSETSDHIGARYIPIGGNFPYAVFFSWLTPQPWRWRRYFFQKRLVCNGLRGGMCSGVRTSYPVWTYCLMLAKYVRKLCLIRGNNFTFSSLTWIIYHHLWGYKFKEKLHPGSLQAFTVYSHDDGRMTTETRGTNTVPENVERLLEWVSDVSQCGTEFLNWWCSYPERHENASVALKYSLLPVGKYLTISCNETVWIVA